jgi:hypothetical protein
MKKLILAICLIASVSSAQETVKIFGMQNQTDGHAVEVYNKFHWALQQIFTNYPQYFDMSNTNVLYTPLNGKQATTCWSDLYKWTNSAGTIKVHWWYALPEGTEGIPLKKLVLTTFSKDQLTTYMANNSCVITNLPIDSPVITNAIAGYTFGTGIIEP